MSSASFAGLPGQRVPSGAEPTLLSPELWWALRSWGGLPHGLLTHAHLIQMVRSWGSAESWTD